MEASTACEITKNSLTVQQKTTELLVSHFTVKTLYYKLPKVATSYIAQTLFTNKILGFTSILKTALQIRYL